MSLESQAISEFYKSMILLAQSQNIDPQLSGPTIKIVPTEPVLEKAIKVLQTMDSNYFAGVREIRVSGGNAFGFVESGKEKDPSIINININKIKSQTQNDPAEAIFAAAATIAHEKGHIMSFDQGQGFVGGESPAEAEEARVANWIKQNIGRVQHLLDL